MSDNPLNIIIGTRGSELALWQANFVKNELEKIGLSATLKVIKTQGDKLPNLTWEKLDGKGFFTKELEHELSNGTIDLAVHSYKDLPTNNPLGLVVAAVSEREDPSELLLILKDQVDIKQKLSIKFGKTIGTSSSRRRAQLLAVRPDLQMKDLRGNIPTRIQKLRHKYCHGIILAKAGVLRLNLDLNEFHVEALAPSEFIPAPAQGVLAMQIRASDTVLFNRLQLINHADVEKKIAVERQVLHLFDAGCHTPLGCYCRKKENIFQVWTSKANTEREFPDRIFLQSESTAGLPEKIVSKLTLHEQLPKSIFITRQLPADSYLRKSMQKHHISIEDRSLIRTYPIINKLDPFILKQADWLFFSSKNAIDYFFRLKPELSKKIKLGVLGRASREALRFYNRVPDFTGEGEGTDTTRIGIAFGKLADKTFVVFPGAKDSLRTIQQALSSEIKIMDLPIYETIIERAVKHSSAELLIFTSPSNVEAYFSENLLQPGQRIMCIGKSTSKKVAEMDVAYVLPHSPDELGLVEAIFGLN